MTASSEEMVKLLGEANIRPKTFLGGPASDYRLVVGKGSTLLSEHIASGRKVPAIEVGPALSSASTILKLNRGGAAAVVATATVATVATVYGAVRARRALKETRALRAEVEHLRQDQTTDRDPHNAASSDSETATPEGAPILIGEHTELLRQVPLEPGRGQKATKAAARRPSHPGRAPLPPGGPSTGDRTSPDRDGADGGDDVAKSPVGADEGHASLGLDVVVDTPPGSASTDGPTTVKVDWVHTVERQVEAARAEGNQGRAEDGVERLRLLLFFLDNVPGEQGSPLYPEITVEPLVALIELALDQIRSEAPDDNMHTAVAEWITRLKVQAAQTADDELSARANHFASRLEHKAGADGA